jgi:hypothetical protein
MAEVFPGWALIFTVPEDEFRLPAGSVAIVISIGSSSRERYQPVKITGPKRSR